MATATSSDEDSAVPEESGSDDEDVSDEDSEDAGDEEDGQLRFGMEPLQQRMYVKGLVALVFAQRVTQERLDGGSSNSEFQKTLSDIFGGSETLDPDVVRAALEASEARAYLVVMNEDHRFTLVHHLARLNHELRPSNPIVNQIVAFGDDIHPTATSPSVWVFDGRDKDMFARLHLPEVNLKETQRFYSDEANRNDMSSLFKLDLAASELVQGLVTRLIPLPMEWASLFVDNPTFGTAIRQMFNLFNLVSEEDQVERMPILEMMATACCGADNSGEARSTLSSVWTQLKFHKGTRLWAEEAWKMHQPPAVGERAPSPVPQVVQSPEMKVRDLFGNRPLRPGVTIARAATAPVNPPPDRQEKHARNGHGQHDGQGD